MTSNSPSSAERPLASPSSLGFQPGHLRFRLAVRAARGLLHLGPEGGDFRVELFLPYMRARRHDAGERQSGPPNQARP